MRIDGFSNATDLLRGGVYILVHKNEVVYVGKSKRMLNRLSAHLSAWSAKRREKMPHFVQRLGIYYDEVHICPCHPDRIDALEQSMIDLFRPRNNTQHKLPGPTTAPFSIRVGNLDLAFNHRPPAPELVRRI